MARLAAALVATVVVAGCGTVSQTASTGDVIPWLPLTPNLVPPPAPWQSTMPIPAGTPACTADQLQGAVIGHNGAMGNFFTYFAISGLGPGECYLDGTPSVTLLDAAGRVVAFRQRAPYLPYLQAGPALVEPGPAPPPDTALKYGQAGFAIDWVTQPEFCPGSQPAVVSTALIAVPAGGTLSLRVPTESAGYACKGLGVSSFAGPYIPAASPPTPVLPAADLQVTGAVRAGQWLQYRVTLTNDTLQPIDLVARCPTYEEEMFADLVNGSPPLGGKHIYALNCKPAGTLPSGKGRTFEMKYQVVPDAPPGDYTLVFMLGYWNAMTTHVEAPVKVTA